MEKNKLKEIIHVYFVPGLAANISIFENIKLPEDAFEIHFLEWILPIKNETIQEYAKRMCTFIKHENIVLIGVSFGGIVVQEMALHIKNRKTIIISSIKNNTELPNHMKFAKKTKLYKLLPTILLGKVNFLSKHIKGNTIIAKRIKLYNKFLFMKQTNYLNWAIENVIMWRRITTETKIIHIHGDKDMVFPIKNIKDCILVSGGTHIMILTKYKWFNENLPKIILK